MKAETGPSTQHPRLPRSGGTSRKQVVVILVLTLAYVTAAAIFAIARGNSEFIFYIMVMAVIVFGLTAVHRRVGLSRGLLWCLSFWGRLRHRGADHLFHPAESLSRACHRSTSRRPDPQEEGSISGRVSPAVPLPRERSARPSGRGSPAGNPLRRFQLRSKKGRSSYLL